MSFACCFMMSDITGWVIFIVRFDKKDWSKAQNFIKIFIKVKHWYRRYANYSIANLVLKIAYIQLKNNFVHLYRYLNVTELWVWLANC